MASAQLDRQGDIAIIRLDNPPVAALGLALRQAIAAALDAVEADPGIRAAILIGAGATFPAGADIAEFGTPRAFADPSLPDICARLEAFPKLTVAAIHGTALGGGLELAMACAARVAVATARLGLPEVNLGLLPGAGGTQRLPRLAGAEAAVEMMTSGRPVSAARALELGIVDALVDALEPGAIAFARTAIDEGRSFVPVLRRTGALGPDPELFARLRAEVGRRARGRIAPMAILDCVEAAATLPPEQGLAHERQRFLELMGSPQQRALVHAFFAEREARKLPGLDGVAPVPVARIGVLGAGTMGGGIAMTFANAGLPVTLVDASPEALARGQGVIARNYATSVERGSMPAAAAEAAQARISGATDMAALADADLIIEAVFEDMALKQRLFAELDRIAPAHAVLATNTSSLSIDAIAGATRRPEAVVGMHFFSPANVMRLLEVVRGPRTGAAAIATAMELGRRGGKLCVLAGDCFGFIGNRMLVHYVMESEFLLEEGASPEQVDGVAEAFGMAMGPIAMRDLSGLDVGLLVRKVRAQALPHTQGERGSQLLDRLLERGRLGQKSGKGFYAYEGRRRLPDPEVADIIAEERRRLGITPRAIPDEEIRDRLFMALVVEGAKCLEDGTALRAGDIDVAYLHGYGFPAHRGGPMWWGREEAGLANVVAMARRQAAMHGASWGPSPLLERVALSGEDWPKAA